MSVRLARLSAAAWIALVTACAAGEELDLGAPVGAKDASTGHLQGPPAAGGSSGAAGSAMSLQETGGASQAGAGGMAAAGGGSAAGGSGTAGGAGGVVVADGGRAGASGGSGAAGSDFDAGTSTGGPKDASFGDAPTTGFSVQYEAFDTEPKQNGLIHCDLRIVNGGSETVPLEQLALDYYITNEAAPPLVFDMNYAGREPGGTNLTSVVKKDVFAMKVPATGASSYIELWFPPGSPTIGPGQSVSFDWQLHNYASRFDETDDYSYKGTQTTLANWDHVVLYRGGSVLWGIVPP